MEKPSSEEINFRVKSKISFYANYPLDIMKAEHKLKGHPIMMNNRQIKNLTLSLRAYVKHYGNESVYKYEIEKSKTVETVCELIKSKILKS